MPRRIAISNLTLLPGSLALGPKWAWDVAKQSGYDALKVNPLRGWDVATLRHLDIPVTSFEYLWRHDFRASLEHFRRHKDLIGFVADTCFIGYTGAKERCEGYAWSDHYGAEEAVGIDFPAGLQVGHLRHARETEYLPEKWLSPLDDDSLACLDTWHVRSYPNPAAVTTKLIKSGRVIALDVQTRAFDELVGFVLGEKAQPLDSQLDAFRALPETVSASVELPPQHVLRLMGTLACSYQTALAIVASRVRECL
jgi:hypothetical protein